MAPSLGRSALLWSNEDARIRQRWRHGGTPGADPRNRQLQVKASHAVLYLPWRVLGTRLTAARRSIPGI